MIIKKPKIHSSEGALVALAALKKTHGENIAHVGGGMSEKPPRIPTGLFPLDLALNGGFPRSAMSVLYGTESSGKSTVLYKLLAQIQREGSYAVLIDVEGSYDKQWATFMGVNTSELIYVLPATAEEALDTVDAFMNADDVGIVGLDSLAALSTSNEVTSEAAKATVGGMAGPVNKLLRKTTSSINLQRREGNMKPALVMVNQVRSKIGVMYGNPETMPGGWAPKFFSSLSVRLYGKFTSVKEVSQELPAFRTISGTVEKYKVPIFSKSFEYDLCLIPHKHLNIGDVDSWNTASHYAKNFGLIDKLSSGGWMAMGEMYKTLEAIKEQYHTNLDFVAKLHKEIILKTKPKYFDSEKEKSHGKKKPFLKTSGAGE